MKKLMIIPIALFALLVLTATFFIGIYVASRSPVLPKDTVFQVDGYFPTFKKQIFRICPKNIHILYMGGEQANKKMRIILLIHRIMQHIKQI